MQKIAQTDLVEEGQVIDPMEPIGDVILKNSKNI
jgi:hypothetical protein